MFAGSNLTVLWKIYRKVGTCTDSVYQALFPPTKESLHGFEASLTPSIACLWSVCVDVTHVTSSPRPGYRLANHNDGSIPFTAIVAVVCLAYRNSLLLHAL